MSPQLAPILADLDRIARTFDLDRDGLGERLFQAFTDGVQATIAAQQAPDGERWDELSEGYASWKAGHHPGQPMARLYDLMADPDEVAGGPPEVSRDHASVTYGRSEEARQEAEWFQEGDPSNNQPPRPFWGFTEQSEAAIEAILDARFDAI